MASSNPYIGPRSFRQDETIYGRDREVRQLLDRLISERIVLLHSPSGAGKTSLIQAGLLPRMKDEGFFIYPIIRLNREQTAEDIKKSGVLPDMHSFNRYVFSTLLSLEESYKDKQRMKTARLARMSLQNYLAFRSIEEEREGPELVIFDQFEELLTLDPVDRDAKKTFFTHIATLLKNTNRWALFAMRTDYVGALEPYARSIPTGFSNTFHLDFLGPKAALEAIQKPAKKLGVNFTDSSAQKLVDDLRRIQIQLLDGTSESQLGLYVEPVQLQVVCYRVWEGKAEADTTIDDSDLANVGDVNHSLAEFYASSVARVAEEHVIPERSIREWFGSKLITPEGGRSQARLGSETVEGMPIEAVRRLEDMHLVRVDKRSNQTWFELSHDRLVAPIIEDNRTWLETHLNLFQRQAAIWSQEGFSDGLLLRDKELEEAKHEASDLVLTPIEKNFLEASIHHEELERRDARQRRFIQIGFVLSIIFLLLSIASFSVVLRQKDDQLELFDRAAVAGTAQVQSLQTAQVALTYQAQALQTVEVARQSVQTSDANKNLALLTATAALEKEKIARQTEQAASTQAIKNYENYLAAQSEATQLAGSSFANSLAAESYKLQQRNKTQLAALLAIEAFRRDDTPDTRRQILSFIANQLVINRGDQPYNSFATTSMVEFSSTNDFLVHSSYTTYSTADRSIRVGGVLKLRASQNGDINDEYNVGNNALLDTSLYNAKSSIAAMVLCYNNSRTCVEETILLFNAKMPKPFAEIQPKSLALGKKVDLLNTDVLLAISPDGSLLAGAIASSINGTTYKIWDAKTCLDSKNVACPEIKSFTRSYKATQMRFVSNKMLAIIKGTNLNLLDLETGAEESLSSGDAANLLSVAISPDGKKIATGTANAEVILWDVDRKLATAPHLVNTVSNTSDVLSLAFSPDGRILAAGYAVEPSLILWDMDKYQPLLPNIFKPRQKGPMLDVSFSEDGKRFASAGDAILIWEMDPNRWQEITCEAYARRNLTKNEWAQYFGQETYRLTCPGLASNIH